MAKAKKKKSAKKSTPKKRPAKKSASKKRPAKKSVLKKRSAKKSAPRKSAPKAAKPQLTPSKKPKKIKAAEITPEPKLPKVKLPARDRKHYESLLFLLRDRLLDGIKFLSSNNLRNSQKESSGDISSYSTHMADAGTDAFDREFALSLVSNEQDALYEVTEALKRLESHTYSVCEMCGKTIPRVRLNVLPFARLCIRCQEISEKGNRNPRRQTQAFPQFQATEDAEAEAEEEKEQA